MRSHPRKHAAGIRANVYTKFIITDNSQGIPDHDFKARITVVEIAMETVELAFELFELHDTRSDLNPIILMHGLFWNKFLFKDLATDICKETKRKVYTLDLRCHGESPVSENFCTEALVEDVKHFMEQKDLKTVAFISHSFSSSVAYLIALEKPEAVEKLVFIDHPTFASFSQVGFLDTVTPQVRIQNRLLNSLNPQMTLQEAKNKFFELAKMGNKGVRFSFSFI
ncbi:abhydrolase domain-containing protein 11 [Trichonephila inaurata madagascariensis]|uniref:sn-1-specific diacylglycerol lipase ABHD11 n=1 Tax=Trichonephila inaurata madagascariensis TaxID=2747483 RepID=A0A8X6XJS4_9ARAC|nr:abhydrolase domain-containing protein 11 [Trichonephila inaurata madagascariensis]